MDEIIENPVSTNQEAEVEQPLEELAQEDTTNEAEVDVQKLIETNKKLYARVKKAEEKAKATPKEEKPVAQKTAPTDDIDSILTLQAEGRTPTEIKSLREYSRRLGKPINEVANDPVIKAGFDALRQKTQTENAIPSPSKRAPTFKGKTLTETVLTGSPADVQAAIEQTLASKLRPKAND